MFDANGTNFQLLLGPADWTAAVAAEGSENVVWEGAKGSVVLRPDIQRFPPRTGAARLTPEDRRGADVDRFGNWYWIDETERLIRTWRSGLAASTFWDASALDEGGSPPEDGGFDIAHEAGPAYPDLTLSGLAVNCRHFLIVGTLAPRGLLIFDLHGSGPPVFSLWPDPVDVAVFDMETGADGSTWILDRAARRVWRLDERVCLAPFGATATEAAPLPDFIPDGTVAEAGDPIETPRGLDISGETTEPLAIIGLPDGTVLILDAPEGAPSRIIRYGSDGALGEVTLDSGALAAFEAPPESLRGHDMAFLPDPTAPAGRIQGALLLVDDQGDQALRFAFGADATAPGETPPTGVTLTLLADYLPLRRYEGRALVSDGREVFSDLGERWIALAIHPRRRRRAEGVLGHLRFDSGEPGLTWHRIVMDACIPPGSSVTVEVRAADDPARLDNLPFDTLPRPYLRAEGAETPFWEPFPEADPARATGSWETLIQSARGRYLDLRLTLAGDGSVSPRIRALRLHMPRFSYLERYLPAVYRQDEVSARFLDRFLANVEGLFTAMEDRVATAYGLTDTRIAPPEALDWLAGWLGATLGPDWDDARRRLFIDNAELLFRWRGTPAGLKALIDIATDPCPDAALLEGLLSGNPPEPSLARRGVRLSEAYQGPALIAADETLPALEGWSPVDGAAPIHAAYRDFVLNRRGPDLSQLSELWGRGLTSAAQILFAPLLPAASGEAEDWRAFTDGPIGFAYANAGLADAQAWQNFIAARYSSTQRARKAHGLIGAPVAPGDLPLTLPSGGQRLTDWIDFVSGVLVQDRNAHRFTVLAPVTPNEDTAARDARIDQITDIVTRERPAHTVCTVQPYWALFQTGTARLGIDTALGEGARFTAIELGRSALGEGFIGYGHPYSVRDRAVVGRDQAGEVQL